MTNHFMSYRKNICRWIIYESGGRTFKRKYEL